MIEVLQQADRNGLNADDYDGPRWSARVLRLRGLLAREEYAPF